MKKLFYLLIFYSLTIPFSALGQNHQLTIHFDTLYPHPLTPFFILLSRPAYDEDFGNYMKNDTAIHAVRLADNENGLKFQIDLINYSDSIELHIPLDNDGGFLKISNLKAAKNGLIRFDKWTVYSNCLRDTIISTTEYYKRNPEDDLPEPFKVKKDIETIKKTCVLRTPHYKTSFKINDRLYLVSFQIKLTSIFIRHGHGYNKDINKPYPRDKKLIFRHTIREHKKYSNEITVRLRNEA